MIFNQYNANKGLVTNELDKQKIERINERLNTIEDQIKKMEAFLDLIEKGQIKEADENAG